MVTALAITSTSFHRKHAIVIQSWLCRDCCATVVIASLIYSHRHAFTDIPWSSLFLRRHSCFILSFLSYCHRPTVFVLQSSRIHPYAIIVVRLSSCHGRSAMPSRCCRTIGIIEKIRCNCGQPYRCQTRFVAPSS